MDIITLELRPANRKCTDTFTDIAKVIYEGMPIFKHACKMVNSSVSYVKAGRKLELVKVEGDRILVRLYTEEPLEMASKALSGFSRELLRVDERLNPKEDDRMFKNFTYKSSLFRSVIKEDKEFSIDKAEMSDVAALQECLEIFFEKSSLNKEKREAREEAKNEIKKIITNYVVKKMIRTPSVDYVINNGESTVTVEMISDEGREKRYAKYFDNFSGLSSNTDN